MVKNHTVHLFALCCAALATSLSSGHVSVLAETVLLDFSSTSCGPCQQMRPVLEQLAAAGYQVREVDIHREPQAATQFGVTQVPTFVVLIDGREADRTVGLTSFAQLEQMITRRSPRPTVSPVAVGASPLSRPDDLSKPQAGRIVAIQDPARQSATPVAAANPFPNPSARQPTSSTGSPGNHRAIVEATVKITVDDAEGKSTGTGTIVDARSGEALILTCGHLFRSSAGKGLITVTLFQMSPQGAQLGTSFTGRLVEYDLERDLGLLSIRPNVPVQTAKIAPSSKPIPPGTAVASVGCDGGQNASVRQSRVTANDRYQGPGNIEVAGAPVEGRSGGGLFNTAGELVGVCFAADPEENEGLYASVRSIHAKLDDLGLALVYQAPATRAPVAGLQQEAAVQQAVVPRADHQLAAAATPNFAVRGQDPVQLQSTEDVAGLPAHLNPVEQAAWEEIQRRGVDSEVICIIRPHSPDAKSEVITLNNASPEFVRQLSRSTPSAAAAQLLR